MNVGSTRGAGVISYDSLFLSLHCDSPVTRLLKSLSLHPVLNALFFPDDHLDALCNKVKVTSCVSVRRSTTLLRESRGMAGSSGQLEIQYMIT